ncbi:MAG: helix-turn-helix domain-containing protein [Bacteroidales bacterium]|jgi:DNA-binding CsgD family transcriptional regulator|nr:helix-turn-helix domain-containing protein [Bacteroidales bacterium]
MSDNTPVNNNLKDINNIINQELHNDTRAYIMLSSMFNDDKKLMLNEFIRCRYNKLPITNNKLSTYNRPKTSPPKCNKINKCPNFGIVCRIPFNLSRKEYIILTYLSENKRINQIATLINCSNKNINSHLHNIQKKLSLTGTDDLILYAKRYNL